MRWLRNDQGNGSPPWPRRITVSSPIGNTNSRYRFSIGAGKFVNEWSRRGNRRGPAYHCAVGLTHIADRIEKLGALPGKETARVC